MLDFSSISSQSDYVKIFYNNAPTGTGGGDPYGGWQTWTKPRSKCNFIWMMCIGAGNGGIGAGTVSTATGWGGGSGAITTAIFSANVLPDTLYVWPGKGGAGGLGNTATTTAGRNLGTVGGLSFVAIRPVQIQAYASPNTMDLVCSSGNAVAVDTVSRQSENKIASYLPKLLDLGIWNSVAGKGRATLNVSPLKISADTGPVNGITCPGADGGGVNVLSVNIGANLRTPTIEGAYNEFEFTAGRNGEWFWKPMYGTGGAGGINTTTTGGNGGDGAYGCGGGGAGPGNTIGGAGGKGGDGLVIIATF